MPDIADRPRAPRVSVFAGFIMAALAMSACSDDPLTRTQARDRAAGTVCDFYARCMNIGVPPAPFTSRDDCLITWKSNIDGLWPAAECTTIVQTGIDLCIAAIRNQTCDNAGLLLTLGNCSQATVCGTP